MKGYLIERTIKEFDELDNVYSDLFDKWNAVWNYPAIHNKLYSCYTRLKIVSLLLRSCIQYKLVENLTLKTKEDSISLKDFCDYCIHHSSCSYTDNRNTSADLEVYLVIDTDKKKSVSFIINKNIKQIRKIINQLAQENHMGTSNELDSKDEASIVINLSSCLDILALVSEARLGKGTLYLIEALFIRLRHIASYFTRRASPLRYYKREFDEHELSIINNITNLRIASAHPEANQHWLNEHFMISGGMNFKDDDVQIQYGVNKLFLIGDILCIYKKMRNVFAEMPELPRLAKHPAWEQEEKQLGKVEEVLKDLLKNPEKLLRK